jgi:RHS repeat-associated protein
VGGVSYTWDQNGNLTSDGTYTYISASLREIAGRLVGVESVTTTVVYTYNGDGVRVAQSVDGVETQWVQTLASHCTSYNHLSNSGCGLPQVLVETTSGETTLYAYGLSRLAQIKGNEAEWFLGDALGSVRQIVDDGGDVVLARDYTPFGQPLAESGTGSSGYAFTGEQYDISTGLVFLRARYYQYQTGRFLSPDPWNGSIQQPGTLHKYLYVLNNAINFVDPSGYFLQCRDNGTCFDNKYSISNPYFTSHDAAQRRKSLLAYNDLLAEWAQKGWITDLDAFAEVCDYAVSMIPKEAAGDRTEIFVYDVGAILTEVTPDKFTYYGPSNKLGQSGFDWVFRDPGTGGHQPHHYWAYVTYVFNWNSRFAPTVGNLCHETWLTSDLFRGNPVRGRSYQDFALGQEGVNLGVDLKNGNIAIEQVGDYIRRSLGPRGTAVSTWSGTRLGEAQKRIYAGFLTVASWFAPIPPGEQGGPPLE